MEHREGFSEAAAVRYGWPGLAYLVLLFTSVFFVGGLWAAYNGPAVVAAGSVLLALLGGALLAWTPDRTDGEMLEEWEPMATIYVILASGGILAGVMYLKMLSLATGWSV